MWTLSAALLIASIYLDRSAFPAHDWGKIFPMLAFLGAGIALEDARRISKKLTKEKGNNLIKPQTQGL
jgi:hypothetical protein